MTIRMETISLTAGTDGIGTAVSTYPYTGEVLSIRIPAAAVTFIDGTADLTFTRVADGGTILAASNVEAPNQYQPREAVHSTSGGTSAYALGIGPVYTDGVPINGYLQAVIAQGGTAGGTTDIYVYLQTR